MPTLRLMPAGSDSATHGGEVFACAFTPDSAFVLSGGWDGQLCLWDAASGAQAATLRVSDKPVSACAVSPDGKHWLSGSLDGLLAHWDAESRKRISAFVPSGRPLSGLVFDKDPETLAIASWDGNVTIWKMGRQPEGRMLNGHTDIVSGCMFIPGGQSLLSWSYDRTVHLWDIPHARVAHTFKGHTDRILAGTVSPDGRWAVTGGRDRTLRVWDLAAKAEAATRVLKAEVRGCSFLLDGEVLVAVDANGRLTLHTLPDLDETAELVGRIPVQCVQLSPSGSLIALGCENGQVRIVAVDGFDSLPLSVTATQTTRRTATALQRFFGRSRLEQAYVCVCPVCRQSLELPTDDTKQPWPCPHCRRQLRVRSVAPAAETQA